MARKGRFTYAGAIDNAGKLIIKRPGQYRLFNSGDHPIGLYLNSNNATGQPDLTIDRRMSVDFLCNRARVRATNPIEGIYEDIREDIPSGKFKLHLDTYKTIIDGRDDIPYRIFNSSDQDLSDLDKNALHLKYREASGSTLEVPLPAKLSIDIVGQQGPMAMPAVPTRLFLIKSLLFSVILKLNYWFRL